MVKRDEIERILHDDLERARTLYDSETTDFRVAIEDVIPADANHPDKTAAIRTAGTERRAALEAYSLALKRFTEFVVNGVVPDDLKKIDSN